MYTCSKCGKPLTCSCSGCGKPEAECSCEASDQLGQVVQSCPLQKGAIWVHVVDDADNDIPGVTVKRAGQGQATDSGGTAKFEQLDPGREVEGIASLVQNRMLRTWPHLTGTDGFTIFKLRKNMFRALKS